MAVVYFLRSRMENSTVGRRGGDMVVSIAFWDGLL